MSTVVIIGTGLIGTSVALAARRAGHQVYLTDRQADNVRVAEQREAGAAITDGIEPDIVVVCVPPAATAEAIRQCLDQWPGAIVTDTASIKSPIIAGVSSHPRFADYVPGHPMAGREKSGPEAARAELFIDRTWLLTPEAVTSPLAFETIRGFVQQLGAVDRIVPADRHDQIVALTSHSPQVISSLLAGRLQTEDPESLSISGQGLRDVVRIARSDPSLWQEILLSNADEVAAVLHGFAEELRATIHALEQRDATQIHRVLTAGNQGVRHLPSKHGGAAQEYDTVPVEIADTPGALATVFAAAGEAEINLEDVRIEHTIGRLTAIAHLSVLPQHSAKLRDVIRDNGWRVLQ